MAPNRYLSGGEVTFQVTHNPERNLGPDADGLRVHFLWPTVHRKELIERKVERRRCGQKLGNVMHATQDDLSSDELRARLAWVARQRRAESWSG